MYKEQILLANPNELSWPKNQTWPHKIDDGKSHSPIRKMDDLCKRSNCCMNEPALILESQRGNLDSFNQLVLAYQNSLFNTALRILSDSELAADATQDAFISAFRSINSYRGGSFRAWLMRTVTNACYDELRRQKRRPTVPLEPNNDEEEEMETPRWVTDPGLSPEEKMEAAELEHAIQHCLDTLPANFRTIVVLVDIQGMDYSEVASAVHVPLGTVKSRLSRARLRLREHLQGFYELLPATFRLEKEIHQ
jgi:RNA polymerase sigma-70 factor (ECF subfamily)